MAVRIERQPSALETPSPNVLEDLVREYKKGPLTPELANTFWKTFLEISIKTRGLDIAVPTIECDRAAEDFKTLKREKRIWVPQTGLTLPQLGRMFPEMRCPALQNSSPFKDIDIFIQDAKGVDVEASIKSPNSDTKERDLERRLKSQVRQGIRLSTLILASQMSKLTTNEYLDENARDKDITWSRVLGTRYKDGVLVAFFDSNGRLYLHVMDPQRHSSGLGGRSERVRKVKRRA